MKNWIVVACLVLNFPLSGLAQEAAEAPATGEEVVAVVAEAPKSEWNADAGLNGLLSTGNSVNQTIGGNGVVSWKKEKNKVEWKADGNYGRAKDPATGVTSTNTENWKTSLRYDRFVVDPLSFFGSANLGADQPAGYDLLYGGSVGLSHEIWRTKPNFFKYEVGYDFTQQNYLTPPNDSIHSARIFAQYKHDFSTYATFSQDVESLFNMKEGKDIRLNTLTALTMKITDIVAFKAGFEVRFDNEPVPGKKKTDTTTIVGLVFDLI